MPHPTTPTTPISGMSCTGQILSGTAPDSGECSNSNQLPSFLKTLVKRRHQARILITFQNLFFSSSSSTISGSFCTITLKISLIILFSVPVSSVGVTTIFLGHSPCDSSHEGLCSHFLLS